MADTMREAYRDALAADMRRAHAMLDEAYVEWSSAVSARLNHAATLWDPLVEASNRHAAAVARLADFDSQASA